MRWLPADVGVPPLRLKIELTLISFVDWLLAAATLYACIYLSGEHVKPGLLLGAFAGAGVLGLVSQVPGGLGVFDGLILLALTEAGYDKASVFSGLMLFRIAYYLLPLFGGLYLGSEMLTQRLPLLQSPARAPRRPSAVRRARPAGRDARRPRHAPARDPDVRRRRDAARFGGDPVGHRARRRRARERADPRGRKLELVQHPVRRAAARTGARHRRPPARRLPHGAVAAR